jgi:hypothetical protein
LCDNRRSVNQPLLSHSVGELKKKFYKFDGRLEELLYDGVDDLKDDAYVPMAQQAITVIFQVSSCRVENGDKGMHDWDEPRG